jgi:S-methylmethionine-dependent homocysteine/selenocysteine methylase
LSTSPSKYEAINEESKEKIDVKPILLFPDTTEDYDVEETKNVTVFRKTSHDISKSFYSAWDLDSATVVKKRKRSVM